MRQGTIINNVRLKDDYYKVDFLLRRSALQRVRALLFMYGYLGAGIIFCVVRSVSAMSMNLENLR